MTNLLAGDIGGTHTRLYLFSEKNGAGAPLTFQNYPSADYISLESILTEFYADRRRDLAQAVFGVAGPVISGRAQVTNLPWVIEESALRRHLGCRRVTLINDLQAAAYALPYLKPSELLTLNAGQPASEGNLAIIAAGTGLGEAFLTTVPNGFKAWASEGGHVSFAPCDHLQISLLQYLSQQFGHVSYERVCSGIGIGNLYAFFRERGTPAGSAAVESRVAAASDPTPIIIEAALQAPATCPLCVQVVETFMDILGAAAGNLALKVMATGGLFVGGGIPPRLTRFAGLKRFMHAFRAKGRMAAMLENIPVHIIQKPEVAVFGAACYALHKNRAEGKVECGCKGTT